MIEHHLPRLINILKVRVIIMDLSKAFDSLKYELLLAKHKVYGLDNNSVTFLRSYLKNRFQFFKINNSFIEWGKVLVVVR